ncbi:farnesyl diphosphate synthase [Halomonas sp. CUBES01]|uniref:(2E,6E)-farnesyl diphosphate synthase n=1 Tax=Vreelandella gomseomensis TaxID=370766 RepID=A0ABU1G9G6_9GAMM|nr:MULTISPECIES: farnesyl diphosphate synthase [Halomonas]MDR5874134.1 (2E,6E)-farnesyl diphosphate synthase [Halomonas gomseomensis]MEC4768805.1 farnesyl diphosphate synthase [Halomonas sp. CUBES01]
MVAPPAAGLARLRDTSNTRVDATLGALFDARPATEPRLEAAMRHGLLVGGKRLRPLLVYLSGRALGAGDDELDAPAAAIELIHAYSLIHDDLPAMDDDDLRRGQPTVHKAFDEATAILAGDALQALAFEVLASTGHPRLGGLVTTLASAAGRDGMVAGQALDLAAVGGHPNVEALAHMHAHKTGALIVAAVRLGGLIAVDEHDPRLQALIRYARAIGLAFQIHDDVLDVTGDTATLGKTSGADAARAKPTYPGLLGLEGAQHKAQTLIDEAIAALAPLGTNAQPLADLAHYMIERDY